MTSSFKGAHFPKEIILMGIRWYLTYPLSTRHVEELMEERGVELDHATINRWVIKYGLLLAEVFHRRKRAVWISWRLDETSGSKASGNISTAPSTNRARRLTCSAPSSGMRKPPNSFSQKRSVGMVGCLRPSPLMAVPPTKPPSRATARNTALRLPPQGQVSQQHRGAGPSRSETGDSAHVGVQSVRCRTGHLNRHRVDAQAAQAAARRWEGGRPHRG
jgi:hypothetical protein